MKHIKPFEQFINELLDYSLYLKDRNVKGKVYHVSRIEINKLTNQPMWFALEKTHSTKGWFKNIIDENGKEAYQYEADIVGKIADINDPVIKKIFSEISENPLDWQSEIIGNPSPNEVMKLKGTIALIKAGWDGLIYSDYDPRNWSDELDALIIFNPLKTVKNFKLIKKYSKK